jgi:hypothetical protein
MDESDEQDPIIQQARTAAVSYVSGARNDLNDQILADKVPIRRHSMDSTVSAMVEK